MHSREIKDDRDVVFGKVVMVASVVKTIGVVGLVVRIVEGKLGVGVVAFLTDGVKLCAQLV